MNGFMEIPKAFYVLLVVIVITATSNSVNLTDGLDDKKIENFQDFKVVTKQSPNKNNSDDLVHVAMFDHAENIYQ